MVDFIEIVFSVIYLPIIFTIATFLLYKAIKLKANNVIFLSIFFYLTGLDYIFVSFGFKDIAFEIFAIFNNTSLILLLFFIKYTFYREKKCAFRIILGFFIILRILDLLLRLPYRFTFPLDEVINEAQVPLYYLFEIIVILNSFLVKGWFFYVTLRAYFSLKNLNIEPWVKKRYLLVSLAILGSAISVSLTIFIPPIGGWYQESPVSLGIAFLKLPFLMLFYFGSLIGWVMPNKLKNYFNRNYQSIDEEELTEEELMNLIKDQLSST